MLSDAISLHPFFDHELYLSSHRCRVSALNLVCTAESIQETGVASGAENCLTAFLTRSYAFSLDVPSTALCGLRLHLRPQAGQHPPNVRTSKWSNVLGVRPAPR